MNQLLQPNQQKINELRKMYQIFTNNPQGFIDSYKQNNPLINNLLQGGTNPNIIFDNMLKQYGMTREEFKNLFI